MNRQVRRVGYVLVLLFALLLGNALYVQVVRAPKLNANPSNKRQLLLEYSRERGPIVSADGRTLAESTATRDTLKYLRTYPLGDSVAHAVGYYSFVYGSVASERAFNPELLGSQQPVTLETVIDRLSADLAGNQVTLTLDTRVQQAAVDALGKRKGAVVALDPKTGAILALYSYPAYDPNPLASHDGKVVREAFNRLNGDPDKPLLSRAIRDRYPPGSTFKIVTAAAALEAGVVTPQTTFPVLREIDVPQTSRPIRNFGGSACGGDFVTAFAKSCNTVFAGLAMRVGGDVLHQKAAAFGFDQENPFALGPVVSVFPAPAQFAHNVPLLAFAGIGQGDVAATPLEMALVSAAVANKGAIMVPQIAAEVVDEKGNVLKRFAPQKWLDAIRPDTAATLTQLMRAVVERGSGRPAAIGGVAVAGKTGTAQTGRGSPHAWFTGFAPAEDPKVAVAVIVENGGDLGDEATGGRVAAPIARSVMQAAL